MTPVTQPHPSISQVARHRHRAQRGKGGRIGDGIEPHAELGAVQPPCCATRIPPQRPETLHEPGGSGRARAEVIAKRTEERSVQLVEARDLPERQPSRQRIAEGRAHAQSADAARRRRAGECSAGQHARPAHGPGRRVQIQEALTVNVRVSVRALLVGGAENSLHHLVVAELIAVVLRQQCDPARYERSGGRCPGIFEREVTLTVPGRTIEAWHWTCDVDAGRCQAELLCDAATVGEVRDPALRVRCHNSQGMTAQFRYPDRQPRRYLYRGRGLDRAVKVDFAAGVARRPHVDGARTGWSLRLCD